MLRVQPAEGEIVLASEPYLVDPGGQRSAWCKSYLKLVMFRYDSKSYVFKYGDILVKLEERKNFNKTTTPHAVALNSLFWVAFLLWRMHLLQAASGKGLLRLERLGAA